MPHIYFIHVYICVYHNGFLFSRALKNLASCLLGKTGTGCDGSTTLRSLASATSSSITTLGATVCRMYNRVSLNNIHTDRVIHGFDEDIAPNCHQCKLLFGLTLLKLHELYSASLNIFFVK